MTGPTVLVQRDGDVGVITLNRPEVLNAMNAQLSRELSDAAVELEQDPEINAIVLSGAGRAFSAGADIKEMARLEKEPVVDRGSNAGSSTMTIASGAKPVIAAINGLAFGGGALLASAVDIRFGCEKSRFRFLGVVAGRINSTWSLSVLMGMSKAKELLFSGRIVEAEEALSIGLLDRLVPSERLLEETMEFAHTVAGNPPEMVQGAKRLLQDYIGMGYRDRARMEQEERSTRLKPPPVHEAFKDFLSR